MCFGIPLRLSHEPDKQCHPVSERTDRDSESGFELRFTACQQIKGRTNIGQLQAKCDGKSFMALAGISGYSASAGSCTMVTPPASCTALSPAVPSFSRPVRMTPITRSLNSLAADLN